MSGTGRFPSRMGVVTTAISAFITWFPDLVTISAWLPVAWLLVSCASAIFVCAIFGVPIPLVSIATLSGQLCLRFGSLLCWRLVFVTAPWLFRHLTVAPECTTGSRALLCEAYGNYNFEQSVSWSRGRRLQSHRLLLVALVSFDSCLAWRKT